MVSTLKLPVGIDSFEKIRRNKFYYIDKTKLIEQLVETGGEVTLFTRPRRFGKTLNMSMLKSFFEVGTDESLFDGLYISGNKELCDKYMGKYPVIFLSLKSAEGRENCSGLCKQGIRKNLKPCYRHCACNTWHRGICIFTSELIFLEYITVCAGRAAGTCIIT